MNIGARDRTISGGNAPAAASVVHCILAELVKPWLRHLRTKVSVPATSFLRAAGEGNKT